VPGQHVIVFFLMKLIEGEMCPWLQLGATVSRVASVTHVWDFRPPFRSVHHAAKEAFVPRYVSFLIRWSDMAYLFFNTVVRLPFLMDNKFCLPIIGSTGH
jgi:hypothetical protein